MHSTATAALSLLRKLAGIFQQSFCTAGAGALSQVH